MNRCGWILMQKSIKSADWVEMYLQGSLQHRLVQHSIVYCATATKTDISMGECKNDVTYYNGVILSAMSSLITSLTIVYSTVYWRRRSKNTSKLHVTGLCEGNSPVTDEFPAQRASNAENVSIWWRHHDQCVSNSVASFWHKPIYMSDLNSRRIPLFHKWVINAKWRNCSVFL